jgi:heme-degrading monooxygenase HmoA
MHLAQVNIATSVAPLTDPQLAGFVEALEPVNALADAAPGFVWRLQTEDGDATALRAFDDDEILVNMSVWTSVEALAEFVYSGEHRAIMARRREFFVPMREAFQVLWWVPEGTVPTIVDAEERLMHLRRHGPTPYAFTFRRPFPAPEGAAVQADDDWLCPV